MVSMERPFNGAAAHFYDGIFRKGEFGESTPVEVKTIEDIAQLFAAELKEPDFEPYVIRLVTALQAVKGVEGIGLLVLGGRHMDIRLIGDFGVMTSNSDDLGGPGGDEYNSVVGDWYDSHPDSKVSTSLSCVNTTFKGSPELASEIQEEFSREEEASVIALLITKPT